MLSPADAALADRDRALPGLGFVLDPEALVEWLDAELHGTWIVSARPRYVRYKPGGTCLVAYTFVTAGGWLDGFAKAYRRDAEAKAVKAMDKAVPSAFGGPGVVVSAEQCVSVQLFPNDRRVPTLQRLSDPGYRRKLLGRLLGGDLAAAVTRLEPLRYKPERRWIGVVHGPDGPAAVLRLYAEGSVPELPEFSPRGGVRVPRVLGVSADHAAVAVEWLDGQPLDRLLAAGQRAPLGDVGQTLRRLHDEPVAGLPVRSHAAEAAAVRDAAATVAALLPAVAAEATSLGAAVAAQLEALPRLAATVHGDFSPDQVVVGDAGVGIIDFDAAAAGDPAEDLGRFAAALRVGAGSADLDVAARWSALLGGYGAGPELVERARVQTAASLLRVAAEPFRQRVTDWPDRCAAVLSLAAQELRPVARA